ncbi:EpsG family protein [Xenorhabdus stockiae]|uniref:EpsG family protein n=1 Tax=Xenorhabdus stockiae TaxID=351614 RepID=UPI003CF11EB5
MNIFSLIFRVTLLSPLICFFYFPFEYNLDYTNYYPDYINSSFTYDFLYEWTSFVFNKYLNTSFETFWLCLMISQIILLSILYNKIKLIILAYPCIITMSQFFYGTQVRYSIAILISIILFLRIKGSKKNIFLFIIPSLFHYGSLISIVLLLVSKKIKSKWFILNNTKIIFFFISSLIASKFLLFNLDIIVSYTRFSYYIGNSSYFGPKSLSSTIYIAISLLLLIYIYTRDKECRTLVIKSGILLLLFCILFSSIAILSGRVLLVYFLLEPIIIYQCMIFSKYRSLTILLLTIYFTKNLFYLINNEYYFYPLL